MYFEIVLIVLFLVILLILIYRLIYITIHDEKKNQQLYEALNLPEGKKVRKDQITEKNKIENWFFESGFFIHTGDEITEGFEKRMAKMNLFGHYVENSGISFLTKIDSKIIITVIKVTYEFEGFELIQYQDYQLVGIFSVPNNFNGNEKIKNVYHRFKINSNQYSKVFKARQLSCEIFEHKCYLKCNKVLAFNDLQTFIQLIKAIANRILLE